MGLLDLVEELAAAIGNTPVIALHRIPQGLGRVYVKLEYTNPTGSHKDRIAVYMVRDAIERKLLGENGLVVEASSGNTAISVAWVAARLGLRAVIVVKRSISQRKKKLIELFGARLVEVPDDMEETEVAEALAEKLGGVYLRQYGNPANLRAHYETTGPELYKQLGGRIDYFVMGMGTCGTLAGVGRYLREKLGSSVRIVGVTPRGSALVGGGRGGEVIEGLATSHVPDLCKENMSLVDEIIEVSSRDAVRMALRLAREEALPVGPSTGAALHAALEILGRDKGARVAIIAADNNLRYESLV
ncbi:MAG: cysteine synthase family protein [Pyrodictiaceae archaeon]